MQSLFNKLLKKLAFLIISVGFIFSNVYADSCGSCYSQSQQKCEQKCSRYPASKKELCLKSCLVSDCKDSCGYSSAQKNARRNSQESSLVECDYCQRRAQNSCLQTRCRDKGRLCVKHCVSSQCRNKCNFPTTAGSLLNSNDEGKQKKSCNSCKKQVEKDCKSSCGSGVGSISCSVACIERNCFDACLID